MTKDEKALDTLKLCYRKHVCDDQSISWSELSDALVNALSEIMGDDEFSKWDKSKWEKKSNY